MKKVNKRQLRVIARNLVSKVIFSTDFDVSQTLSEEDEAKLEEHIKQVAYSITKVCYRSHEWGENEIVKDVLKNVK